MRRLLALLALGAFTFVAAPTVEADPAAEQELLVLVNRERAHAGLPPVVARQEVGGIAEYHSQDMRNRDVLEHNEEYFTDGTRARLDARVLGENVAYGPTIEAVHAELMASDGHRHNVLDPRFTVIGIGIVRGPDRWWVTQDFVQPR